MLLTDVQATRWQELTPLRPGTVNSVLDYQGATKARIDTAFPASSDLKREHFLSADGQVPSQLELEVVRGHNDLLPVNFLERCLLVRQAIGRLEARQGAQLVHATGFLVAPGLLLTNHHVLHTPEEAQTGSVEFDAWTDVAGETNPTVRFDLDPVTLFLTNKRLDYSLVAVQTHSRKGQAAIRDRGYLRLHPASGKVQPSEYVTIIQHPDGEPMQIALRENQVTRAQPAEAFIQYETDTAHGSSGAPVFNDSLQVAALHSGGRILRTPEGWFVLKKGEPRADVAGLTESDVEWEANAGIRISAICAHVMQQAQVAYPGYVSALEQAMAGGDLLARAIVGARTKAPEQVLQEPSPAIQAERQVRARTEGPDPAQRVSNPSLAWPFTLRLSLEGGPGALLSGSESSSTLLSPASSVLESEGSRLQIPVIYDALTTRRGYDPAFLGEQALPLPRLTKAGEAVAAPLLDEEGFELRYHKFSIFMHRQRRLALFTAANVDWRKEYRLVGGHKPTREQLTGVPAGVAEEWVPDARLAAQHQLPDVFFTKDRKAFDKGHLVRRDDVCWGNSFADMQMANGDTYHVTNCSPQTKAFNQSPHGEENWGDLEAEIEKQTKAEWVMVFSGPVLDPGDRWFRGEDQQGPVRVQIPARYWKIVVAREAGRLRSYGFSLQQDVHSITEEELSFSAKWSARLVPVADIVPLLRGWVDLSELERVNR